VSARFRIAMVRFLYVRRSDSVASPLADAASGKVSGSGVAEAVLPCRIVVSVRFPFGVDISTEMVLDLNGVLFNALTAFSAES
jgi:hypothetical protein